MEGHDSLLLGWYPTPTTPAYPSVDLPPGPQAPSTSNLVRLPPGDYPDLRTPIIQQHEPGETTAAGTTSNGANTTAQTAGPTSGTATAGGGAGPATIHLPAAAAPAAATGGGGPGGEAAIVVNVAGRMGSASSQQNAQQQQHTLHLSGHHIVTPSVAQLHVTQAGTAATMVSGTSSQLGGQTTGTGAQVLQQVVAQAAGGGHQLVHMVLHHPAGTGQTNSATAAVSMGGTLQIGGLASVGSGVTVQALTAGMPSGGLGGGGIVNVGTLGVLEGEEAVGVEGGPPFRCEECGHVAKTKRMLKRHLATVHSQERNYPCPYCDAKYKSRSGLRVHSIKHNVGKHKCDVCDKLFPYKGALEEHMKVVHEDFRFRCTWDGCEFSTTSKYLLKGHVSYNHEGGKYVDNKFRKKCRFCEYVGYDIRGHESAMHGLEPRFECPTCGKKFHFGSNLRQHKKVHLPVDQYPFVCHVCGDRFLRRRQLEDHYIGKHTNEKPHLCVKCGFSCASRRTMSDHAAANCYEKEAAMRCKFCAFETKIPFTMRTHKEECHPKHIVKRKKQRKAWQSDSGDDGEGEEGPDEDEEDVTNAEQQSQGVQKGGRKKSSKVFYMPWSVKPDQGSSDAEVGDEVEEAPTAFVKQELLDGVAPQSSSPLKVIAPAVEESATIAVKTAEGLETTGESVAPTVNPPRKRGRPPKSQNGESSQRKSQASNRAVPAAPTVPSLKVTLKPTLKPAKLTVKVAKRKTLKKRGLRKRRKSNSEEDELSDVDDPDVSDLDDDDEDDDDFEEARFLRELEANDSDEGSTKRRSSRRRKKSSWRINNSAMFDDSFSKSHKRKHKMADGNRPLASRDSRVADCTKKEPLLAGQQQPLEEGMSEEASITTDDAAAVLTNIAVESATATFAVPAPPKRPRGRPPKRKAALASLERVQEPQQDFLFEERLLPVRSSSLATRKASSKKHPLQSEAKNTVASTTATTTDTIVAKTIVAASSYDREDNVSKTSDEIESHLLPKQQNQTYEKVVNDDDDAIVQISFGDEDGAEETPSEEITMMNCFECNMFFIDVDKFRDHMKNEHQFEMVITAD